MTYSNMNNSVTIFLCNLVFDKVRFSNTHLSQNFKDVGFEYANFLQNSIDKIIMITLLTLFMVTIYLLSLWNKNSDKCLANRIHKTGKSMRYENYTKFWVEIMLNLTVGLLINLWHGKNDLLVDRIANSVASLFLVFTLLLILYCTMSPLKYHIRIQSYLDYNQRHSMLFYEFKSNLKCILYYSFFLIRRLLYALVIIILNDFVKIQCVWI